MKNLILFLSVLFLFSLALPATSTNVDVETVEADATWCWATYSITQGIARCKGTPNDCTKPCVGPTKPIGVR